MAEGDRGAKSVAAFAGVPAFVRGLTFDHLPGEVVESAQRSLLDLIGVAAAGSRTRAAAIANSYAATQLCGSDRNARILFDGRRAGIAGAAFAGATTIDALDAHDGHVLTKGHAGVALLPALLALIDGARTGERAANVDGREFLVCLVLGYEIATRAGIALHSTVRDYHCSGAWNSLGCAAIAARLLDFDDERTRHALGIAEYFGPRGQILRACDFPTMVKDGSGWGAHAGVSAALLAGDDFTGAPALTIERDDAAPFFGRPRHALAHFRAVFQGVSRVPVGAARDRGGARSQARARLRGGRRRRNCHREFPRSGRARLAVRDAAQRRRKRSTASRFPSPRRSSSAVSARMRSTRPASTTPAWRGLLRRRRQARMRNLPIAFPPSAGHACASRLAMDARSRQRLCATAAIRTILYRRTSCARNIVRSQHRFSAPNARRVSNVPSRRWRSIVRSCQRCSRICYSPWAPREPAIVQGSFSCENDSQG